jgi:hypothetical protein
MPDPATSADIRLAASSDGTLTYLVDYAASELPAVRGQDILAAWDAAREAALRAAWDVGRGFRFRKPDGGWTDLTLQDRDARCWAGAVSRAVDLQTGYGLSVCLRLLALVDLLGRAPWALGLLVLDRHAARVDPALLRLAAETRLTDDGGFDETGLRARLLALPPQGDFPGGVER